MTNWNQGAPICLNLSHRVGILQRFQLLLRIGMLSMQSSKDRMRAWLNRHRGYSCILGRPELADIFKNNKQTVLLNQAPVLKLLQEFVVADFSELGEERGLDYKRVVWGNSFWDTTWLEDRLDFQHFTRIHGARLWCNQMIILWSSGLDLEGNKAFRCVFEL